MQEQRGSVESLSDTLEFDHLSSSSTAGMDQDIYWNGMLLHPAEPTNYLLSPSDTNMSFANMSTDDSSSMNIWNLGGPSSVGHLVDPENHDETKMELGWPSPMGGGSEDAENMIALEDVDIDLNSTQIDDEQSFSFSLSSNLGAVSQDLEHNSSRASDEASESGLFTHPYVPRFLEREHAPSSLHTHGSSSGTVGFSSGDADLRPGSSLDGRRLACKRKNIEGLPGQSSASESTNFFHINDESNSVHSVSSRANSSAGVNISGPSGYMTGAGSSVEQPTPIFDTITRGAALNGYPAAIVAGTTESSQRNFRLRINPSRQTDLYPPSLSSSRDNVHNSNIWIPNEPSSSPIPFNHRSESRSVAVGSSLQNQSPMSVMSGLSQQSNLSRWNGASTSRRGSLSSSIHSIETLTAIGEGTVPRNNPRNDVPLQPLLVPTQEIRNLARDSANWSVANGNPSVGADDSNSRAGMSSALRSSLAPTWIPPNNPRTQFSRGLAEAVHRTLLASVGSESQNQSSNFLSQQSGRSSTSHEVGHHSGSASRVSQRQALLPDRQSDGTIPMSMRGLAREGRSRMMSEIRNAVNLMRRGEILRLEDVLMFDHPLFRGVADLHDRHRDMRLDVDNMSYEELLALEERIGNVNTGLGEETILKSLKHRKHFLIGAEAATDTEPCCICQEEYKDGEDLGALDCGHDFHTACIKEWLTHKNLCPICKTTALVT